MSVVNQQSDRDIHGRLKRGYRGPYSTRMGTPMYWVHQHMTRPRRVESKRLCKAVTSGCDPDGIVWPTGGCKPHYYYW